MATHPEQRWAFLLESIIEPSGVADDIWRASVAFIDIHRLRLPIVATHLGNTGSTVYVTQGSL